MTHAAMYLKETMVIASGIRPKCIEQLALELSLLRKRGGHLFLAGLGGSSANCSHAANDFRKLCGIGATCLSDNAPELTARANDEGWGSIYSGALMAHDVSNIDALFVLSVGGGRDGVSLPLINAVDYAKSVGMRVLGIVGRDGGYTKAWGDCVVVIPTVSDPRVTPHVEGWQLVILHCLVSHPLLQKHATKW